MSLPLTNAISFPSGEIAGCDNEGRGATTGAVPLCAHALNEGESERNGNTTATAQSDTRTGNLKSMEFVSRRS
jgi:hypothetical protein